MHGIWFWLPGCGASYSWGVTPTHPRLLLAITAVAAAAGWSLAAVIEAVADRYLPLPLSASAGVWLLAIAVAMWGWIARPRLLRRPGHEPLAPVVAARTAALALAGSRVGAGVAGTYLGIALMLLPDAAVEAARSGLAICGLTIVGALALIAASMWLERMCRLPGDEAGDKAGRGSDSALGGLAGPVERRGE